MFRSILTSMNEKKLNYFQDISTKIVDDSLSITTITAIDDYYVLALQTKIEAFDNSGIGHLYEHLIIDRAYEMLKERKILDLNTHIYGATYPNYIIFYIDSSSYICFCEAIDIFFLLFENIGECRNLYNTDRGNKDRPNSIYAELERRENNRISVIWQNFYYKRFCNTEFKFNSGGYSSELYLRSFDEIKCIWEKCSQNKVNVVLSVPQYRNIVRDKILSLHRSRKFGQNDGFFDSSVLPINKNRYETDLPSSFSYGIGIVNSSNIGNDFWESLLYNTCSRNERIRRGVDLIYDNAAAYGMYYFGIHTIKKYDHICSSELYDMFLQFVCEVDDDSIEAMAKQLDDRLKLIDLDEKRKCIEIIARIMQKFRRNQIINESLFGFDNICELNGQELKASLVHMLTDFRNIPENNELLFCYQ